MRGVSAIGLSRTDRHPRVVCHVGIDPAAGVEPGPATTISAAARAQAMRTLREDGWRKVRLGQTTIEEVLRVTQTEEHVRGLIGDEKAGVR